MSKVKDPIGHRDAVHHLPLGADLTVCGLQPFKAGRRAERCAWHVRNSWAGVSCPACKCQRCTAWSENLGQCELTKHTGYAHLFRKGKP